MNSRERFEAHMREVGWDHDSYFWRKGEYYQEPQIGRYWLVWQAAEKSLLEEQEKRPVFQGDITP